MHREPDCALGLLIVGLLACALGFWTIVAHPTPAERANAMDRIGKSTGVTWR